MNAKTLNRIFLREVEATDFDVVFRWENDPKNWVLSGVEKPYTSDEIRSYVNQKQTLLIDGQTRRMVILKSSGTVIGAIDLFKYDSVQNRARLGILIDETYRRQKYASEALSLIERLAVEEFGLECIECHVLENNKKSQKLFESNGYQKVQSDQNSYFYLGEYYPQMTYQKRLNH